MARKFLITTFMALFCLAGICGNSLAETVKIVYPNDVNSMPLAKTKEAHAELLIAGMDKNEKKYREMLNDGSTIRVQRYTNADVIQKSGGVLNVRLLDGKHKGESVWVSVKWTVQK